MVCGCAKSVQRYGILVNAWKKATKSQWGAVALQGFTSLMDEIVERKVPILCNKYAVLHKKYVFCAIGVENCIGKRVLLYTKDYFVT